MMFICEILNAIYDAIKVRLYELPATPDKVIAAIVKNKIR